MNKFVRFFNQNRPSIFVFAGLAGLIGTAVMAYKSYPIIADNVTQLAEDTVAFSDEPTPQEVKEYRKQVAWVYVKTLWPTFTLGAISTTLIILGNSDHINRKNAALAAYYISESTLKDYQKEVIEELGEKKERALRDRVSKKRMEDVPVNDKTVIISDSTEPWICDTATGYYFKMGYEKLRRIIAEANLEMFKRDYLSVADFYDMLDVKTHLDDNWDYVGWNSRYPIDPIFTSAVREIHGQTLPCMVMEYRIRPFQDFCYYG